MKNGKIDKEFNGVGSTDYFSV